MLDENICECGHTRDEHGNDPKMRGSSACQAIVDAKPCECICFEEAEEAEEARGPYRISDPGTPALRLIRFGQ